MNLNYCGSVMPDLNWLSCSLRHQTIAAAVSAAVSASAGAHMDSELDIADCRVAVPVAHQTHSGYTLDGFVHFRCHSVPMILDSRWALM